MMLKPHVPLVLCALAALPARAAIAGTVTGSVKLSGASEAERTVVYLTNVPEGSFTPSPSVVRLSQRGATFKPALLAVMQGTQVDMTNDDWVAHNVFSKSQPKPFDLGLYAQDTQKVVTFDKLGVVQVFCSIHPRMNAVILVLQNPFYTKPDREGRFSLAKVPAGTYELKVYRMGGIAQSTSVTVPSTGNVEAKF